MGLVRIELCFDLFLFPLFHMSLFLWAPPTPSDVGCVGGEADLASVTNDRSLRGALGKKWYDLRSGVSLRDYPSERLPSPPGVRRLFVTILPLKDCQLWHKKQLSCTCFS